MQNAPQKTKPIVKYHHFLFILPFAIVAAHFIVTHGENHTMSEYLIMPTYYYSLFGSSLISSSVMQLIHLTTCRLDKHFEWEEDFIERTIYQLLFGVVLPAIFAVLAATLYFHLFNLHIKDTRYLKYILLPIIEMILIFNLYYMLQYFMKLYQHMLKSMSQIAITATAQMPEALVENSSMSVLELEVLSEERPEQWRDTDILLIYHIAPITYVITADGTPTVWPHNITFCMRHLSAHDYFKIRPSFVVKRETIKEVKTWNKWNSMVILNFPFKHPLIVSARNKQQFKKWLKG